MRLDASASSPRRAVGSEAGYAGASLSSHTALTGVDSRCARHFLSNTPVGLADKNNVVASHPRERRA
jgi:hypothetical protein